MDLKILEKVNFPADLRKLNNGEMAELAEEIRRREEENARRANDRARRIMEQERKEAELEKIADEAAKRKSKRQAMLQAREDEDEDSLKSLDHYFDDKES